jgi:hypothetical protein
MNTENIEEEDDLSPAFRQRKDAGIKVASGEAIEEGSYDPFANLDQPEGAPVTQEDSGSYDPFANLNQPEGAPVTQEEPVSEEVAPVTEAVEEAVSSEKTGYEDLYKDTKLIDDIRTYWIKRVGKKEGSQADGETNEEYVNRFMIDQYRPIVGGRLHTAFIEADWLAESDDVYRRAFGRILSKIEEKAPEIYEQTFEDAAQTAWDYLYYGITDPTNIATTLGAAIMTGGVGIPAALAATKATAVGAIRQALISRAGGIATSALIGGAQSATQEYGLQRAEREAHIDPQTMKYDPNNKYDETSSSFKRIAIAGAAGTVLDAIPGFLGSHSSKNIQANKTKQLAEYTKNRTAKKSAKNMSETLDTDILDGKTTPEAHDLAMKMSKDTDADFKDKATKAKSKPLFDKDGNTIAETGLFEAADGVTEEAKGAAIRSILNIDVQRKLTETTTEIIKEFESRGMTKSLDFTDNDGNTVSMTKALESYREGKLKVTALHANIIDSISQRMTKRWDAYSPDDLKTVDIDLEVSIIDDAISKAGLTRTEFINTLALFTDGSLKVGDVSKKSVSDAAKILRTASIMKNNLNKFFTDNMDDEVLNQVLAKHADKHTDKIGSTFSGIRSIIQSLDRARIASLTSQLSTTARNNITGIGMASAQTGADIIDSVLYHTYNGLRDPGSISVSGIKKGMKEVVSDSFATFGYLASQSKSQAIIEATMSADSLQYHRLLRSNPDLIRTKTPKAPSKTSGAPAPEGQRRVRDLVEERADQYANFMNTFNIASDAVFRRAYYARSLRRHFNRHLKVKRDAGEPLSITLDGVTKEPANLDEWLMAGKLIDKRLVKNAIDDALHKTFAGEVKYSNKAISSSNFVRLSQSIPFVTTAVIPFPRFVVHAAKTVFEYSPFDPAAKLFRYAVDKELRTVAGAADARQAVGKGLVGTATFMWAFANREQFPELQWYEIQTAEGDPPIDARPLYPLNVYLAAADLFRGAFGFDAERRERTTYDVIGALEGMTSLPFRTGATDAFAEGIVTLAGELLSDKNSDSVKADKTLHALGTFFGEVFGGYTTPARMVRDVAIAFDKEEGKYRQRSTSENSGGFGGGFANAFWDSAMPDEAFGVTIDSRRPVTEYIANSAEKQRYASLSKFNGITRSRSQNLVEAEQVKLGIKKRDIFPTTSSELLDASIARHVAPIAEERVAFLIKSDRYQRADFNGRKEMFKAEFTSIREEIKDVAKLGATDEFKRGLAEIDDQYRAAIKTNQPTEVIAELQEAYAEKYWYAYTGPVARAKWMDLTREQKVRGERYLAKRYTETVAKLKAGDHISGLDRLMLRGGSVADSKLYGLAAEHAKAF